MGFMDHRASHRHPLALLAGRCGPVMTKMGGRESDYRRPNNASKICVIGLSERGGAPTLPGGSVPFCCG